MVNVLHAAELFTLKWLILCCVNFMHLNGKEKRKKVKNQTGAGDIWYLKDGNELIWGGSLVLGNFKAIVNPRETMELKLLRKVLDVSPK